MMGVIDLSDDCAGTAAGRMIKTILKSFGYKVARQKEPPKASKEQYFVSASYYEKKVTATIKIIKTITEIW